MHKGLTKDFKFYIDGFNKQPGHYTEDELIQIGVAHQQLFRGDKDWIALAEYLGLDKTGEQFRKWILHARYKQNLVPKNPKVLDDKTVENVIAEDVDKSLMQQKQDLVKEKMRLRDERTSLNAKLRDEARVERFLDELKAEAKKLNDNHPFYSVDTKITAVNSNKDIEAVALLSDLHIGMEIDELCNRYNKEIAAKRLDKWADDVVHYCKLNGVCRLNILNLGDLIAGEIHPSIRIDQEEDVASQVIHAGELLAKALYKLQDAAPEVYYRSVSDNHSRFMPDKHQSLERENFFRLIDNWLEVRLENTKIKMPKDNVNFRTGKFRLMNGKLCMFEHGHCLKPNQSFQSLIGLVEEYVHYVFLGHYHEEKQKFFQNMKVFVNGSICGTDLYADSIHKYTKPKQSLLIFDKDNLMNISIDLDIRE